MRLGGLCTAVCFAASLLLAQAGTAHAGVIGNWNKSARSWNNAHMTKIKTAMQDAGHRVDPDAAIGSTALNTTVLIMGEPSATPTAAELDQLRAFLLGGGVILLFGDTGIDLPTYNHLLTGIGSSIQFTTSTISTSSALPDGVFTLGPVKISGSTLNVTSGTGTTGGIAIDNNYARYEAIGNGYVVVFGDRIDHNDVISATNTSLLLNVVSIAVAPGPAAPIPALSPALIALISLLLAALAATHLVGARRAARSRKS
jgi:hypothetical protein